MRVLPLASLAIALAACAGSGSTLDPAGPRAERVADLTWTMSALGAAVYVLVLAALFLAIRRSAGGRPLLATPGETRLIVAGGILLPAVVIPLLWALTLRDVAATLEPPADPALTIEVTAHQWWYEVRYPDLGVTVRDELRIPAGAPVLVRVTSADVIHSFWIPRLAGKIDMIPGRTNDHWLQADAPGVYPAICSEFCGLHHASMRMDVTAMDRDAFAAWLSSMRPADR
jgi:cytochrome c oxidase subunit 2